MLKNGATPIRDTSAQDRPVERSRWKSRRRWLVALAVLGAIGVAGALVISRWLVGERSVAGARLRIAKVERGLLVRDAAVTGRVVAAVSPTLYAPVPGIVTLSIRAGDTVKKGDVLATIKSPELENELQKKTK